MVNAIYVIGPAGSGKTLLTKALAEWFRDKGADVATVNLDPGALVVPYHPDADIREYVNVYDIMREENVGPNMALLIATSKIMDHLPELQDDLEAMNPDYAIIDTPGQMDLFAFRGLGPAVALELTRGPKLVLFLFDSTACVNPLNFVSFLFLSLSVQARFLLPQLNLLTKVDITPKEHVERILEWSEDPDSLRVAIEGSLPAVQRTFGCDVLTFVEGTHVVPELIPVSATKFDGFVQLNAAITRVFSGGEELGEV